jgi:hypothetical protein
LLLLLLAVLSFMGVSFMVEAMSLGNAYLAVKPEEESINRDTTPLIGKNSSMLN